MPVTVAAFAGLELEFDIYRVAPGIGNRLQRDIRQKRTAKISMQQHPGEIEDRTQRSGSGFRQPRTHRCCDTIHGKQVPRICRLLAKRGAHNLQLIADGLDHLLPAMLRHHDRHHFML